MKMQSKNEFDQDTWTSRNSDWAHRGRDRRGLRAGNLVKEAVYENDVSNPRVEIPLAVMKGRTFRMVEGIEVSDRLTAADQALWHYLVARAKDHINSLPVEGSDGGFKDKGAYGGKALVHEVKVSEMLAYLGISNPVRLRESLERISETMVRYDIRYRGTRLTRPVRYLDIPELPMRLRSRDVVSYGIDPEVRVSMLLARRFVTVDINALAKFKCRYSARLFVRFSLMASRHDGLIEAKKSRDGKTGRFWIVRPEDLARNVGYPMQSFRMQTFLAVMKKALSEINGLPVFNRRFTVLFVLPTAKVPRFSFAVTEARKSVFDVHRAWIGRNAFFHATAHTRPNKRASIRMNDSQFVHVVRIAQAQAFTGVDALKISRRWRADVEAANAGATDLGLGEWTTAEFLEKIERFGPEAAFERWLDLRLPMFKAELVQEAMEKVVAAEREAARALPSPVPVPLCDVYYTNCSEDEDLRIGDDFGCLDIYEDAA